jgi:hypothetical protein
VQKEGMFDIDQQSPIASKENNGSIVQDYNRKSSSFKPMMEDRISNVQTPHYDAVVKQEPTP